MSGFAGITAGYWAANSWTRLYELDAIAIVVIDGASLAGGAGTVVGTILGVAIWERK